MPRIDFSGFRDSRRRPRFILWAGASLLVIAAVMIAALGITSTRWFCAEGCHKVQDDTILAFEASAHANVSCMACHMPVNANPVEFVLHKAEALGELYLTVTGNYSLPLNAESEVAFEMTEEQCTQCHTLHTVTPSEGLFIDHDVHLEKGVGCTACHNRVAHVEDFELTLRDPETGDPNRPHEDFSTMDGCFRCHVQQGEGAPGRCDACHTEGFELRPDTHETDAFVRRPGAELAAHAQLATDEGRGARPEESDDASAAEAHEDPHVVAGFEMKSLKEIDSCSTCHADSFCIDCHGVEIPHPADFAENHQAVAEEDPGSCANCHLKEAAGMDACDECHHKAGDSAQAWMPQHSGVVRADGAQQCFDCHDPRYCSACHVGLGQ